MTDPTPPQPQTAEQVVLGVLPKHIMGFPHDRTTVTCTCGWESSVGKLHRPHSDFYAHQAAEVVAALGLREELTVCGSDEDGEWEAQELFDTRDEANTYAKEHGPNAHVEVRDVTDWRPADD